MITREDRKLQHTKAKTNKVTTGLPVSAEGSNGDIQIRQTSEGVVLYAKYNNSWYKTVLTK